MSEHADRGFAIVNLNIIRDPHLSSTAFRVYVDLASYADKDGRCWPGVERICADTGLSKATVKRAISDLVEAGYVQRERRWSNGKQTSSVTRLRDFKARKRWAHF